MAAGDISQAMLAAVRFRIGETAADVVLDATIYDYLSEAEMALASEEALDAAMLPLTEIKSGIWSAGIYAYLLPWDFLRERYVTVGGVMARRVRLQDIEAFNTNVYMTPSKTKPFYTISDAQIQFYTGSQNPDAATYQVWYVRKPMWVRAVATIADAGGGNWRVNTSAVHNLTAADATALTVLKYEDSLTAGLYAGVDITLGSYVDTDSMGLSGYASGAATGGRVVHQSRMQVQSNEDPLLPKLFHGMMMDWAVSRCREQFGHFGEAVRQMTHFTQRVEALKERYGGGPAFDGIVGDSGRRTQGG
jgi:hypothetical protein